jgi:preprotein translocase subunit SecG
MILTLVNVVYVLVAVGMIALILLQRGAGAAAGSGFGAGASATVFGARGASNFLSKSTAALAAVFFVLSLGMAMYATRGSSPGAADADLGVMGGAVPVPSATLDTPAVPAPAAPVDVPPAPEAVAPATVEPAASTAPDVPPAPEQDDKGA